MPVKPMLAVEADLSKIKYPVVCSPKYDGCRVTIQDGVVLSRSLKPIRNTWVQQLFGRKELNGFDGELIVGSPTAPDVFQKTTSGVMSKEGIPEVYFYVFDYISESSFSERKILVDTVVNYDWIRRVDQVVVNSEADLMLMYDKYLKQGYEGIMLRSPDQPYKHGRSTVKSQHLLKLKPFVDDEFEVVGFKELMHNENEATINELGYTERSSHKDNKVASGMLGSLIVKWGDVDTFDVGTGFTVEQRKEIWDNRDQYLGKLAKVRYQAIGVKDKPRFPSFIGWRDKEDM